MGNEPSFVADAIFTDAYKLGTVCMLQRLVKNILNSALALPFAIIYPR